MIFQTIYDLLMTHVFATATAVEWVGLVATFVSTIATLFVIAVPFLIVWKVMCMLMGR